MKDDPEILKIAEYDAAIDLLAREGMCSKYGLVTDVQNILRENALLRKVLLETAEEVQRSQVHHTRSTSPGLEDE